MKKISLFSIFLLIIFCLIFSFGSFNKKTEAKFVKDQTPEEYYHIDKRVVRGGEQAFNIGSVIGPIASLAKKYCKDELDEDGNVVEEGYFRYYATSNYFRVEVDEESGYAVGQGKVIIHYEKKCPGYLAAKAFKNSGDVVATIKAKGQVKNDGMIHGTANISLKIPTLVSFTLNFTDSWTAQYTQSFVGPSIFLINIDRFGFKANFPITVPMQALASPQLIGFEIVKEEAMPFILAPDKKEMTSNGQDNQPITVAMEQKAILKNSKNDDTIDDSYEGGVENEEFVIRTKVEQVEIGGKKSEYKTPEKLIEGTCDNSSCNNLVLTTNKEGRASFVYAPPKIEDEEFLGAIVEFQAIHDKAQPKVDIKINPIGGVIEGKLVNINRSKFQYDVKANFYHPSGSGIKGESEDINAGTGDFLFKTKIPGRGYQIIFRPQCADCWEKKFTNLPYIIDLGNIVIGTLQDYEWEVKRDILAVFDKSGMRDLLGDFIDKIQFVYDETIEDDQYRDGVVYLSSEEYMMDANSSGWKETVYHEIFHGIHSHLAEHSWLYKRTKLGGKHEVWVESHERLAFDESLSHFFARLVMLNKGVGYTPSEDYSKKSVDSANGNKNGNITEGKITAFLVDYYKYKNLKPNEILGDLFNTMRSYGDIPGGGADKNTQTIAEWVLTKLWMNPTDYTLNALINKHNIRLDCIENIDWGKFTIVKSDMKGRRTEKERQESFEDKQKNTSSDETKNHNVSTGSNVGKNTTYKVQENTSYAIEENGQCELNNGTVVARNGGAINTTEARTISLGTVYSVTAKEDKTTVKVAKGEVEIINTETWESYIAEAGEEVDVYGDKIEPVKIFDPKADSEFKRSFTDYFYEYFSWINLLILAGIIVILIIILSIIKRVIKRK